MVSTGAIAVSTRKLAELCKKRRNSEAKAEQVSWDSLMPLVPAFCRKDSESLIGQGGTSVSTYSCNLGPQGVL